jgi:hypothetical protein
MAVALPHDHDGAALAGLVAGEAAILPVLGKVRRAHVAAEVAGIEEEDCIYGRI